MGVINLCFLGFGNVGRALARLLVIKNEELRELYGIDWRITGVATRRLGWISKSNGFDVAQLLANPTASSDSPSGGLGEWLKAARPDVLFETTSLNPATGQPAIDHLRLALEAGAHVITA